MKASALDPSPSPASGVPSIRCRSITSGLPANVPRLALALAALAASPVAWAAFDDPNADRNALPAVPPGFVVSFFAREPLVRQPCSMAFDARGRLCVGMGPQYRNPKPETPGDSVVLVLDTDGDGKADTTKVFATGFNAIQGLAWRGRDLWVANAPDLTVVRDLDGDDEADEYVRLYTDLGNLEHGLHGLNWGPDGLLYMTKGNSKGLTQPGRVAPKAFRDLWGVTAPPGTPDFPPPQTFRKDNYPRAYHDPNDDWGREGGVLRCEPDGSGLAIVSRGCRNPWDMAFDDGFNGLVTDNDQTSGDRVFMPFAGAHFGWNHPWSAHWSDAPHAPSAPVSGPLFEGSYTGVAHANSPTFPATHRGVFIVNDWLRKGTFVWRPRWDGALLRPEGGTWEPFVTGGPALYRPTDLAFGPDGALYILGWSAGYGAEYKDGQMTSEGRVFRVAAANPPTQKPSASPHPVAAKSHVQLVAFLDSPIPAWRTDAQEELVRRAQGDPDARAVLEAELRQPAKEARETWVAWALGRLAIRDSSTDRAFAGIAADASRSINLRVQALRILAFRTRRGADPAMLAQQAAAALRSGEARLRFEGVLALREARWVTHVPALMDALAVETESTTYYAAWQALRALANHEVLRKALADTRPMVRRAALLALLEDHRLHPPEVRALARDPEPRVAEIAAAWVQKADGGGPSVELRGRPLDASGAPASMEPEGPHVSVVARVQSKGQRAPRVIPAGFRRGTPAYVDRSYKLREVPEALAGADLVQTSNDDDGSSGDAWTELELLRPARVHVGLDTRSTHVPGWLQKGFQRTAQVVRAEGFECTVFSAEFPAGMVRLGGNTDDRKAGGKGQYVVAVEPLPLAPGKDPVTLDAALEKLALADARRGRWLFFHPRGAACVQCHRLEGRGNAFGPDLAGIGSRAPARHLAESIVHPNAVVTEGFRLETVETSDGEFSGILVEESGLNVVLGLPGGRREVVAKERVTGRRTAPGSAMPAFDTSLPAQDVADVVAFLLSQKEARPAGGATPAAAPASASASAPFIPAYEKLPGRLRLRHGGVVLGDFVYEDPKVLRPHWANLRAPDGTVVSRTHPPVPGVDATDHDTMHPGLWLGFGDVSGADFWRNKGRMEHAGFVHEPDVRDGAVHFTTTSRLVAPDGKVVCMAQHALRVSGSGDAWAIDWTATFRSDAGDFWFGDQEEMGFGARVATPLTEKATGRIRSSTGRETARETWGQPADWCDYSGTVGGRRAGIVLMADNPGFRPSFWHNRDYGVFVANPFGLAAMKQGEASRVVVPQGRPFTVRFGAVLHSGDAADPARWFKAFVGRR